MKIGVQRIIIRLTSICIMVKTAIVLYLPKKESARNPPSKHRRKEVPIKSVTILAEEALDRCIVPPKYVTRFTAIPIVDSLSQISIPSNFHFFPNMETSID